MDSTKTLIERLVEDARPVRRLWPPGARLLLWIGIALLVAGVVALGGLRADLAERTSEPAFLIQLAALLAGAVLLAMLAFRAAIPGREPRRPEIVPTIALLTLGAALTVYRPAHAGLSATQFMDMGAGCAVRTILIALVPWGALVLALRRGAPLAAAAAGALAGAASCAFAFGLMQAVCGKDGVLHVVLWHGIPVLAGVALSAWAGGLLLPRWRGPSS